MTIEHKRYACHGIHEALPKGRASGELTVSDTELNFKIQDHYVHLSFDRLALSLGGASDRLVFISHPSRPDWRFYTADRSLLKNPILRQHAHLKRDMNQARGKRYFNWGLLIFVIALLAAAPIFILANMDFGSKIVANQIPIEWEESLGSTSFEEYARRIDLMDEEQAQTLLKPLVTPLLTALPNKRFNYRFYISANEQLNAFALPGGIIVINSGLILSAESAEEVLGVVSHEITHVRERHGVRNIISSAGTYLFVSALVGDVSGIFSILVDAAPVLINQGYSRKFEAESDAKGFDILVAANVNPSGLATILGKMLAKEKARLDPAKEKEQSQWLKEGLSYLRSHPKTEDRIAELRARANDIDGGFIDLSGEFQQLKDHVEEFVVERKVENE